MSLYVYYQIYKNDSCFINHFSLILKLFSLMKGRVDNHNVYKSIVLNIKTTINQITSSFFVKALL